MLTYVAIAAAGIAVGVINGMAGGASIISYPVLLACGLNPIVAVGTNAVGVTAANFSALFAARGSIRQTYRISWKLVVASMVCAVLGATLLLTIKEQIFREVVPFLLLASTLAILIPVRSVQRAHFAQIEQLEIAASGFYCGYFGPGQGVMVLAALSRSGDRSAQQLNTTKNVIVGTTALASIALYIATGHVDWGYALTLFVGSSIGGVIGGTWAARIPLMCYRVIILSVGITASLWLFASVQV